MAMSQREVASDAFQDMGFADSALSGTLRHVPISARDGHVCVIRVDDCGAAQRADWLDQWITPIASYPQNPFTVRGLRQSNFEFDMILIHADDPDVVIALTRDCGLMHRGKAIIACLTQATPIQHARILRAGADAVLDLGMEPEVAAAYLRSMLRRIRIARNG